MCVCVCVCVCVVGEGVVGCRGTSERAKVNEVKCGN